MHFAVQTLKGNIRVFCRVRPSADMEAVETVKGGQPVMAFPQSGTSPKMLFIEQFRQYYIINIIINCSDPVKAVLIRSHDEIHSHCLCVASRRDARHLIGADSAKWHEEQLHL